MAGDAAGARRHPRAGLGDHPAPAHVGGERTPGRLHRPAGRLPHLQAALPRRSPRRVRLRPQALQAPRGDPGLRPHRGPRLQPHVRDDGGTGQGGGLDGLPAARDRPGDLPELQELPPVRAQEAAVRDRPDRQELPQRDHPRQLHLPHPRVRADGDGVLRAARRGDDMVRALAHRAPRVVSEAGDPRRPPAPAPPRRRRALALLQRDQRRRVPVPDRLAGARGDRQPRQLRPHPARRVLRAEARVRRHRLRRPLCPPRHRARRRR